MIDELTMLKDNLRILKQQRDSLINDYMPDEDGKLINYDVIDSLFEKSQVIRNLYSDKHRMEWILEHWQKINDIINTGEYQERDKREVIRIFAKNFDVLNKMYISNFKQSNYPETAGFFFEQINHSHELTVEMIHANKSVQESLAGLYSKQRQTRKKWADKINEVKNSLGGKNNGRK